MSKILVGVVLGIVLVPAALLAWFEFGHPPVAVADPPLPFERQITHFALNARINHEKPSVQPIEVNEDNLVAGAQIYGDNCAGCHGLEGKPSSLAKHMFPEAPQLWEKHGNNVVGVSDDPSGETFWKVSNGIRLTGMPAFNRLLTETQIWQVSLLLAHADEPLPPKVLAILRGEQAAAAPQKAPAQTR